MSFISVPVKRSWDVDLVSPLGKFIRETYGDDQHKAHHQALEDFNNLRAKALNKLSDRHEPSIQILNQYHDQLVSVETKIPLAENAVRVDFKWQDAFDKETLFAGRNILKLQSSAFERVAILFNIGALASQIAADSANEGGDSGLKTAAKYFQQAAGNFSYLRSLAPSVIPRGATPDLTSDCLAALGALMVAQAQDCIFLKAARDNMKPAIVAKIAQQAAELYSNAKNQLSLNSIKTLWPKDWSSLAAAKHNAFLALAQYFQGKACGEARSFGEQIGRFKYAEQLFKTASQKAGSGFLYNDYMERLRRDLADAEKDNNVIYHEVVPDSKSLSSIDKAVLAKELVPQFPLCAKGTLTDPFERLVPVAVNNAIITFDSYKQQAANFELGRLREATDMCNSVLASLNLPASLEDDVNTDVPPSVLEKASRIRQAGGINCLTEMIQNLPDMLQRNRDLLNETKRILDDEQESDDRLRQQFGEERWRRTPSNKLTEQWRQELQKYQQILDQAIHSDGVVRERFEKQKEAIELMSRPDADIKKALPQGSTDHSVSSSQKSAKSELKQLCQRVDALKAERKTLEDAIQNAKLDNIAAMMSEAINPGASQPLDQFCQENVNKLFTPLRENVTTSLREQESLLAQIQQRNQEFTAGAGGSAGTQRRAELLSSLATAYDQFEQLKANLQEGSKFYADMTELLMKFQTKVNDFVFARKTEKEEMMKDLQINISQQKSDPAPRPGEPSTPQQQAPPRPPPPTNPPANPTYQPGAPPPPVNPAAGQACAPPVPYGGMPAVPPTYLPYPTSYGGMPQPMYMPGAPPPQPYYPAPGYGYGYPPPPPPGQNYPTQNFWPPR